MNSNALKSFVCVTALILSMGCTKKSDNGPGDAKPSPVKAEEQPYHATVGYFDQKLNWDDPSDTRTFKDKYLFNSEFASGPDAPVIFYTGGEAALDDWAFRGLSVGVLARKFKAHYVSLEHRYYGESIPFDSLTTENLRFLNLHSTLEDLAAFQKYWTKKNGLTGKWFIWGGSYGGQVAAYYRQKHPELAAGAISSSGSVQIKSDDSGSDRIAAEAAGPVCVQAFRQKILAPIEEAMNDSQKMKVIKEQYGASVVEDNGEFIQLVGLLAAFVVQEAGPKTFCDPILAGSASADTTDAFVKIINKENGNVKASAVVAWSSYGFTDPKASLYTKWWGQRQWNYQMCTELGGWGGRHGTDPTKSLLSFIPDPAKISDSICQRAFGINSDLYGEEMKKEYYLPLLDPVQASRIIFTNGTSDPVLDWSISPLLGNASNSNFVYLTVQNGRHCEDMNAPNDSDSQSVLQVRQQELETLQKWNEN